LDDPTRAIVAHTPSHRADAGMAWGTLIHGLLEHAMRHKSATREDLVRLAMWLTFEQQELRPVVEEAVSEVLAFTASAFWQLASSSDHLVEVPFLFAQDQTSLLGGVIDLVFKNGDDWEIVDYKTDLDQDENRSAQRHAYQLAAYQKALSSLGIENIRASIRSVRSTRDELKVLVASPGSTNDT
jgi:ATP-dependent helicase/nuclease subunit A